jgi:serine/threonine-protein phosphatase 2B catalytic subunit
MEKSKSVDETPVLKDPFNDRQVKSVPLPYTALTSDHLIWPEGFSKAPDLVFIKDFLKRAGKLSKR